MGNCISGLFDSMGSCINRCMPKRPNICFESPKSGPIQDKLAIPELPSTTPRPPDGRKNVFSDEFLIACMRNNFHLTTQLVPVPKPPHASRSKVFPDASNSLASNSQLAKLGHSSCSSSSFPQQAMLMGGPEKVLLFPSCPDRRLPASHSVSQRYSTNTSCGSNYASTSSSRNITTRNCRIKEVERVSIPSSCSSKWRAGATSSIGSKRYHAGGNLGVSSSSKRKVSKPASGSNSVDRNNLSVSHSRCSSGSSGSLLLSRKEICRHEVRFESSKEGAVGVKVGSSRMLKRKKTKKVVHPISYEDDLDEDTSTDSFASATIDINNPHISLDCFIFV